ncbi:YraN family protein [uncultured Clostridium sp.]|uniref:YraN family protein n=1 Tax=uncultured Clostridium sp. TaxID=59620 RepID=UPI0025E73A5B|nr:YraN family protein [uncultured Clostridium sp.]
MKKFNKIVGNFSEKLAAEFLIQKGYSILELNFRNRLGEIDIICLKENILVIVEVKGRYNLNYGYPQESVNYKKQNSIIKTAYCYISYKKFFNINIRFDVIEILLNTNNSLYKINHIKDAFRLYY